MGIIARYKEISLDRVIPLLKSEQKTLCYHINTLSEGLPCFDLDKRWDYLHFCLTGTSVFASSENNLLSCAVQGSHIIGKSFDSHVAITWNYELDAMIKTMQDVDRNILRKNFSVQYLSEEVYPYIGYSKNLENCLFASIMLDLENLINAYQRFLKNGNHVLIVIVG